MTKRAIKIKNYFLKDINEIIRFLIISDTVIAGAAGLLGPIFAIFITEFIQDANAAVAGIAAGIFLFTKSILQIPIAHVIDKIRGEKDDYWLLVIFSIFIAFMPLTYLIIHSPLQLYVVQFIFGLLTAFTFPTYMALFTRHIDKEKEGTEWGIYFTLTDLVGAAFAIIGGYVAITEGFKTLIIIVVILSLIGALLLLPIKPYIKTA